MPELKHHFRAGKMNKDLDDRLVPNGEYRDAQNIEISTSESDNVGTIQNVRGTTRIKGKTYDTNTQAITANWSTHSFGLTNAVCIGSVLDNESDKIYWFIKSDESDCIAEYDDIKGIISPVLVDTLSILKFTSNQIITGINVIDGMILWTDDITEPKKIDIEIFKSGCSTNFTTHTTFHGVNFAEHDITVAKKAPLTAPTLTMSTSTRGGNGTGTDFVLVSNSVATLFTDADGNGKASGTDVTLNFSPAPNFQVGDMLTLTSTYEDGASLTNYEIKVRVLTLSSGNQTATCKIQSIPVEIVYVPLVWEVLLSEEGLLFEKKLVRFGYRWKYTSGEYSTFSPFSELAFKPSTFEYLSSDGYNEGMINNLRQLTINITDAKPADVDEVDILYKESNNNLIYVVDTLKEKQDGTYDVSYDLESEIIGKVVEANQMLRPWDNVPRKAKAQEVTANRLIYANYLQNYNIPSFNTPEISMSIGQSAITTVKEPELSIKSLRTYQAGVVYVDTYNRQTPVFTSSKASKQTSKSYSDTVNSIQLTLSNTAPDWATHFKYYIKETSNEYYNLSMDRYYLAEDGNVWLSFPSSERNKIQEDSYLILKKQHDADTFVGVKARYKVLDISNDPPDFIKLIKKAIGNADGTTLTSGVSRPQIGSTTFKFLGPDPADSPSFSQGFTSDGLIQLSIAGLKTAKYNIVSGGPTGTKQGEIEIYSVTIDEPLQSGEASLDTLTTSGGQAFQIILFEEKFANKPEFYGRFFAKINRDSAFDTNIIATYPDIEAEYGITKSRFINRNAVNTGPNDGRQAASWYDTRSKHNDVAESNNGHPVNGRDYFTFHWTASPKSGSKDFDKSNSINSFLKGIKEAGTLFRFKSEDGTIGEVYKVTGSEITYTYRRNGRKKLASSKRRSYKITFEHATNLTPYEDVFVYSSGTGTTVDEIQLLEKVLDGDNELLTSNNPAIWETEPKEAVDLDLYYETGNTLPISEHGTTHTIPFKNCYSFGNGVESNRMRDDYNAVQIDKGVKVSTVLAEQYKEDHKKNGLIYSGIFNSTSGINRFNQFIQGEQITKDINPHYGSIQKLHARNTDLITFCEDKVIKILANKDALYNADGNPNLTATNRVLGQSIPFIGEYGISKNPESFASYAYRVYFADKNRGAILRLSRDGLTPISDVGMKDFFKDILPTSTLIQGSYDDSKGLYNLSLSANTLSFDEKVGGWTSFKSFVPEEAVSLNNVYYSIKNGDIWSHTNTKRNRFYDTSVSENDTTKFYNSSVTLLVNDQADSIKGFQTINYSGSRSRKYTKDYDAGNSYASPTETFTPGWFCESVVTDEQNGAISEFIEKEGRWYNYIKGDTTTLANLDSHEFTVQGIGNLTAISGDTSPDDKTVTLSLTGVANTTSDAFVFDVTPGTEIHSALTTTTITITPNTGNTLTAGDLSVSSTGSYVDSVTFAQSGVNVVATINFTDGVNMTAGNLTIALAVTGDGLLKNYLLNDLSLKTNTDSNITVANTYSGSSNATAEPLASKTGIPAAYLSNPTVATKTFTLASNFVFTAAPGFYIESQDTNTESFYTITFQDTDVNNANITIGSGGKVLADVVKRVYTIKYTFPAQETTGDVIIFNAKSTATDVAQSNEITGYRVAGSPTASRFASTKDIAIYGKAGATFSFKLKIDSTADTYWAGSAFSSASSITLTIPSNGVYIITVPFYDTSTTKNYVFTIASIPPTLSLAIPLIGNIYNTATPPVVQNPFTISQYADVVLTLNAESAHGGDFTITSSNITKTYQALGFPVETSSFFVAALSLTGTATGNITKTRDPELTDFSNYNSNGFDWDFDLTSVVIDNSTSPKGVTITGNAFIEQYGTASTTSGLDLDDFLSVAGGASGGTLIYQPAITGSGGYIITQFGTYNDGTYSQTGTKFIDIGVASGTNISGTGVIYGNFYGNSLQEITLSVSAASSSCFHTSTNLAISKTSIVGSGSSQDLHYTWTAQTDEVIDSSSLTVFTVAVALYNEP